MDMLERTPQANKSGWDVSKPPSVVGSSTVVEVQALTPKVKATVAATERRRWSLSMVNLLRVRGAAFCRARTHAHSVPTLTAEDLGRAASHLCHATLLLCQWHTVRAARAPWADVVETRIYSMLVPFAALVLVLDERRRDE